MNVAAFLLFVLCVVVLETNNYAQGKIISFLLSYSGLFIYFYGLRYNHMFPFSIDVFTVYEFSIDD